jgi:hypothetical protein
MWSFAASSRTRLATFFSPRSFNGEAMLSKTLSDA